MFPCCRRCKRQSTSVVILVQLLNFELFTTVQQGFGHVFFNGTIGYAAFFGNFGIGHAVDSIQDKYLLSAQRQFIQYPLDLSQFFINGREFFCGRELDRGGEGLFFRLRVIFRHFSMFDVIVCEVFCNPEQKTARMLDSLFLRFAEKNNEAFLRKVGGNIRAVDNPGQMKLQFGLVI